MEKKLNIKPFKKIESDCMASMIMTILISIDENYEKVIYDNQYHYTVHEKVTEEGLNFHIMEMILTNKILGNDFLGDKSPIKYMNQEDFIQKIKECINNNKYVMVGVDLYYWMIPGNMTFGKFHWGHYSLVSGYNEETEEIYVFDVGENDYDEYHVPIDIFIQAIEAFQPDDKAFEFVPKMEMIENINSKKLIQNANEIIKSIEVTREHIFWIMGNRDYELSAFKDLCSMYLMLIMNRQKTNCYLFDELEKHMEHIGEEYLEIKQKQNELVQKWNLIKNAFMRAYAGKKNKERMMHVNQLTSEAFEIEIQVWAKFCEIMESENIIIQIP